MGSSRTGFVRPAPSLRQPVPVTRNTRVCLPFIALPAWRNLDLDRAPLIQRALRPASLHALADNVFHQSDVRYGACARRQELLARSHRRQETFPFPPVRPRPALPGQQPLTGAGVVPVIDFHFGRQAFVQQGRRPRVNPPGTKIERGTIIPAVMMQAAGFPRGADALDAQRCNAGSVLRTRAVSRISPAPSALDPSLPPPGPPARIDLNAYPLLAPAHRNVRPKGPRPSAAAIRRLR